MIQPLITIIIPVFNRAYCVKNALESVFRQSYKNYEVIVVDDGSTDNLLEVLNPFFYRVKLLQQANGGPSAARNLGLNHAKGEYIAPLDSDDIWNEDYLENALSEITKNGFNLYISNWVQTFDANNVYKKSFLPKKNIYASNDIFSNQIFKDNLGANSGLLIHKDLLTNGWNEKIAIGDDWYLLIEMTVKKPNLKIGYSEKPRWIKNRVTDNVCDGRESEAFRLAHLKDIETIIADFKSTLTQSQLESLNVKRFQNLLLLMSYNLKYSKEFIRCFTPIENCILFSKSMLNVLKRSKRVYVQKAT